MRRPAAAVATAVLAILLAGCTSVPDGEPATEPVAETASASAPPTSAASVTPGEASLSLPLSELENLDGVIQVGTRLDVLIDTPGVAWEASTTDPAVLAVDDPSPGQEARVVTVTAVAAGTADLTFTDVDGGFQVVREFEVVP